MKPEYINIDLELSSSYNLNPIVNELENNIFILLNEKIGDTYQLNVECATEDATGLNETMEKLLFLINNLSPQSKELVSGCSRKVLDIGFNSGNAGWLYTTLSNSLLSKIASAGFDINLSIYGINPTSAC